MKGRIGLLCNGDEGLGYFESHIEQLSDLGFLVRDFTNPRALLRTLDEGYDLFILSVAAPPDPYSFEETNKGYTTGIRLARDLRRDRRTRKTPILLYRTYESKEVDRAAEELGLENLDTVHRSSYLSSIREAIPQCFR